MSKSAKKPAAVKPAPPVQLHCERTGETRLFTAAHAAALLAWQADRGKTDWQPVTAAASATE